MRGWRRQYKVHKILKLEQPIGLSLSFLKEKDYFCRILHLPTHKQIEICIMDWLRGILTGSSREGICRCHEKHDDETTRNQDSASGFDKEEIDLATALSISESDKQKSVIEDDDEQESSNVNSPGDRICAGCNREIDDKIYLSWKGAFWHPECLRCHSCNRPISEDEFFTSDNRPYHESCRPKCDVCKNFFPTNAAGHIESVEHPVFPQIYCPSHKYDGTPHCCSCERMETVETRYLLLDDGRRLCLECFGSSIMDSHECQQLFLEIQEFYEGLNMKVEQPIPLLLVAREALNGAMEGEKKGHHHTLETRGLCLFEEQIVSTISSRPKIEDYRIINMVTEPCTLVRKCEVTAILVLYGLPRLLTGSILAHEMMHAWLRLKGYQTLSPNVEEGICQVLAHMWLESEILAGSAATNVASTSSSSPSNSTTSSFKKEKQSELEKKLGKFFIYRIESDRSIAYGDGFREGNQAVNKYDLKSTLDHIRFTGCFPL